MGTRVLPSFPDAWVDHDKTKIRNEIPLTRHFLQILRPRLWRRSTPKIKALEDEIQQALG